MIKRLINYFTDPWKATPEEIEGHVPYMGRYHLIFKNRYCPFNIFINKIFAFASDPNDMHDHPWSFVSIIIKNGYWEYRPGMKKIWRGPGNINYRKAETLHRVELLEEGYNAKPSWSIVFIGPFRRKWQFLTNEERHEDDEAKELGDSKYVRSLNERYVIFYDDRPRMDTTKK
jgi:hypothetical protein